VVFKEKEDYFEKVREDNKKKRRKKRRGFKGKVYIFFYIFIFK